MNGRTYETKDLAGHIGIPLKWSWGRRGEGVQLQKKGCWVARSLAGGFLLGNAEILWKVRELTETWLGVRGWTQPLLLSVTGRESGRLWYGEWAPVFP